MGFFKSLFGGSNTPETEKEKKDEMAVHSQRHAKSDLYDWACIALLLLIVFSQKGIIHPQIGWGYLCFGLLQGLEALLFYYYEKKEDPLD